MTQGKILGSFDASFGDVIKEIFDVRSTSRSKVYEAFYVKYHGFVAHELMKRNTFTQNFEDLNAKIWVDFTGSKEQNVGLIDKFFAQAARSASELPEVLSLQEAMKLFSVSYEEWVTAHNMFSCKEVSIWVNGDQMRSLTCEGVFKQALEFILDGGHAGKFGFPYYSNLSTYLFARSLVHPDGRSFTHPVGYKGYFMEATEANLPILVELFKDVGFETELDEGYPLFPLPFEGSVETQDAFYETSEVEKWFEAFDRFRGQIYSIKPGSWQMQLPPPRATRKHFINYLKRCIGNRFANFCRYEKRRHQERVWDTFPDQVSMAEDPAPWEDRQESKSDQEDNAEMALLVGKLQKTPAAPYLREIILAMYDENKSLKDAISNVPGMSSEDKGETFRKLAGKPVSRGHLHLVAA